MRVVVLHNALSDRPSRDEEDNRVQLEAVSGALAELGHEVISVPCSLNLTEVRKGLTAAAPDLVFNLVETVDGTGRLIHLAPSLIERFGVPYTGCGLEGVFLTSNKLLAKSLLTRAGLPVPAWTTVGSIRAGHPIPPGRLIVKSVWEHASIGLDEGSILEPRGSGELLQVLEVRCRDLGGSCFAEVFVDGREFNLSVLQGPSGPKVLPPAEMRFLGFPPGKPKVVDYRAKWDEGSFEYCHTERCFDLAPSDRDLQNELEDLTLRCASLFELRGYARVDFRVDEAGRPWILEVNTNPCISPDAGFTAAAARSGLGYVEMIGAIVGEGGSRYDRSVRLPPSPGAEAEGYRDHLVPADRPSLEGLVRSTGFFSEAEVGITLELVDAALERGDASGYRFLVEGEPSLVEGFTCFGPVPATAASYDIYWIALRPDRQRQGRGRRLLEATEQRIRALGGRRIYIETSGRALYRPTRAFYEAVGYTRAAVLRDFYGPDDDKVVYLKQL